MTLPKYAEIDGVRYPISTSYKDALRCFDVIDDPDISDEERAMAVVYILFGIVPDNNINAFLDAAKRYLTCNAPDESGGKKDMDFNADDGYIAASFMSDYHIDLSETDMHFWTYINLIKGLTPNCVLSRIREIRNYDLSQLKDSKARQEMADAKRNVALPVRRSKEETEAWNAFNSLFNKE